VFETAHAKDSHRFERSLQKPGLPAHVRLGSKESERLVRCCKETEGHFETRLPDEVICFVVEVLVSLRLD